MAALSSTWRFVCPSTDQFDVTCRFTQNCTLSPTGVVRGPGETPMLPFRTAVLMKTDIAGSTPRFRALLGADQQTLLHEHRALIARHAADQGGHIIQLTGDGYWLEFPSVTAAAKAAIAMQEALRLAQPSRGDDRISIRVVIGLGDIAM